VEKATNDLQKQFKDLENSFKTMPRSEGSGIDSALLDKLNSLPTAEEFEELKKRVEALEEKTQTHDESIKDHGEKLDTHDSTIKEQGDELKSTTEQANVNKEEIIKLWDALNKLKQSLNDKVDVETFEEEINALKAALAGAGSGGQPIVVAPSNTKELNRLKEEVAKIAGLEELLNKLLQDMKGMNLHEMKDNISDLYDLLNKKADKEDVSNQFAKMQEEIDDLKKQISDLLNKLNSMNSQDYGDVIIQVTNKVRLKVIKNRLNILKLN
jgi:chromosome segregation ATPase